MKANDLHHVLSMALIVLGFFILLLLFVQGPSKFNPTAMFIADTPRCDDNTELGYCSYSNPGNSCQMTRQGPELRFDGHCYD